MTSLPENRMHSHRMGQTYICSMQSWNLVAPKVLFQSKYQPLSWPSLSMCKKDQGDTASDWIPLVKWYHIVSNNMFFNVYKHIIILTTVCCILNMCQEPTKIYSINDIESSQKSSKVDIIIKTDKVKTVIISILTMR